MTRSLRIKLWADDPERTCSMADPSHPTVADARYAARYAIYGPSRSQLLVLASVCEDFGYLCSDSIGKGEAVERLRLMRAEIRLRNAKENL